MTQTSTATLAELTTLRVGGPAAHVTTVTSDDELAGAVRDADAAGEELLLVGDGSNLVAPDRGWPGRVVLLRGTGITAVDDGDEVLVHAAAGQPWDELVAHTVAQGWSGLECLSGIPGRTGATPVQNVGAYGQEVADLLTGVRVLDRQSGDIAVWPVAKCRFAYRDSRFKHTERFVVLEVGFRLRAARSSAPIRYAELAALLGVDVGRSAPIAAVRDAVLELRRAKGMVLDAGDHDTWSAGSFFTNPIVTEVGLARFAAGARTRLGAQVSWPAFPVPTGTKLSAGWLIEQARYAKGYARGPAALSGKHTLALTNRGGATAADIMGLAEEIIGGVRTAFGVTLNVEPRVLA